MTKLLSEEKIKELWDSHEKQWPEIGKVLINPVVFARSIEAAVIEAQGKQKPVAEVVKSTGSLKDIHIIRWMNEYEAKEGDKLYAAPVVPPDMVLVPRELTKEMRDAWDASPCCDDDDEEMRKAYRAMIAAAEGKE